MLLQITCDEGIPRPDITTASIMHACPRSHICYSDLLTKCLHTSTPHNTTTQHKHHVRAPCSWGGGGGAPAGALSYKIATTAELAGVHRAGAV
jgi:hypothetical protein